MTPSSISHILASFSPDEPFTIEEVIRRFGESQGESWAGVFEMEAAEQLEKQLVSDGVVIACGTTTLYKMA